MTLASHHKAFGSARTARGPRALDLVAQGGGRSAAGRTKKGLAQDWRSIHDWLLLQDPVAGGATAAWAPRRARRSPDIHSGLVEAGFVPIWARSCAVPAGLLLGVVTSEHRWASIEDAGAGGARRVGVTIGVMTI